MVEATPVQYSEATENPGGELVGHVPTIRTIPVSTPFGTERSIASRLDEYINECVLEGTKTANWDKHDYAVSVVAELLARGRGKDWPHSRNLLERA